MIERKRLLSLGYYKKAPSFTGSDKNKNYKVEKINVKVSDDPDDTETVAKFQATVWPGPLCFAKTADELKQVNTADFDEEGLNELVEWMNSINIPEIDSILPNA